MHHCGQSGNDPRLVYRKWTTLLRCRNEILETHIIAHTPFRLPVPTNSLGLPDQIRPAERTSCATRKATPSQPSLPMLTANPMPSPSRRKAPVLIPSPLPAHPPLRPCAVLSSVSRPATTASFPIRSWLRASLIFALAAVFLVARPVFCRHWHNVNGHDGFKPGDQLHRADSSGSDVSTNKQYSSAVGSTTGPNAVEAKVPDTASASAGTGAGTSDGRSTIAASRVTPPLTIANATFDFLPAINMFAVIGGGKVTDPIRSLATGNNVSASQEMASGIRFIGQNKSSSTGIDWYVSDALVAPETRDIFGHTTVLLNDSKLLVFFGATADLPRLTFSNDPVSMLDVNTMTYTPLTTTGDVPDPRYRHATVFNSDDGEVLLIGGATYTSYLEMGINPNTDKFGLNGGKLPSLDPAARFPDDSMALYSLNLTTLTWTRRIFTDIDIVPKTLVGVAAALYMDMMVTCFGQATVVDQIPNNDCSVLNISSREFVPSPLGYTDPPLPRYGASLVASAHLDNLYMFGGWNPYSGTFPQDVWALDGLSLPTLQWNLVSTGGREVAPQGRAFSSMTVVEDALLVLGGQISDASSVVSTTYSTLSLLNNTWIPNWYPGVALKQVVSSRKPGSSGGPSDPTTVADPAAGSVGVSSVTLVSSVLGSVAGVLAIAGVAFGVIVQRRRLEAKSMGDLSSQIDDRRKPRGIDGAQFSSNAFGGRRFGMDGVFRGLRNRRFKRRSLQSSGSEDVLIDLRGGSDTSSVQALSLNSVTTESRRSRRLSADDMPPLLSVDRRAIPIPPRIRTPNSAGSPSIDSGNSESFSLKDLARKNRSSYKSIDPPWAQTISDASTTLSQPESLAVRQRNNFKQISGSNTSNPGVHGSPAASSESHRTSPTLHNSSTPSSAANSTSLRLQQEGRLSYSEVYGSVSSDDTALREGRLKASRSRESVLSALSSVVLSSKSSKSPVPSISANAGVGKALKSSADVEDGNDIDDGCDDAAFASWAYGHAAGFEAAARSLRSDSLNSPNGSVLEHYNQLNPQHQHYHSRSTTPTKTAPHSHVPPIRTWLDTTLPTTATVHAAQQPRSPTFSIPHSTSSGRPSTRGTIPADDDAFDAWAWGEAAMILTHRRPGTPSDLVSLGSGGTGRRGGPWSASSTTQRFVFPPPPHLLASQSAYGLTSGHGYGGTSPNPSSAGGSSRRSSVRGLGALRAGGGLGPAMGVPSGAGGVPPVPAGLAGCDDSAFLAWAYGYAAGLAAGAQASELSSRSGSSGGSSWGGGGSGSGSGGASGSGGRRGSGLSEDLTPGVESGGSGTLPPGMLALMKLKPAGVDMDVLGQTAPGLSGFGGLGGDTGDDTPMVESGGSLGSDGLLPRVVVVEPSLASASISSAEAVTSGLLTTAALLAKA